MLCFTVSHRSVLQRKLSVIWLRPGAFRRAWATPRTSDLHGISFLLATAPLQNQEQPRQPVIWFSGLPAVGSVALMTTVRHVNCAASSSLLSHCPSLPSLQTYFAAVVSQSVWKSYFFQYHPLEAQAFLISFQFSCCCLWFCSHMLHAHISDKRAARCWGICFWLLDAGGTNDLIENENWKLAQCQCYDITVS